MKSIRYTLLALLLVPGMALAQEVGSTNGVIDVSGVEYAIFPTQNFGAQFENNVPVGPAEIVIATDGDDTTLEGGSIFDGCEPFDNASALEGNIALISRGACAFVTKAENAANAGAIAYIVHMDTRNGQEDEVLVNMGGTCEPDVCSIPGVFMSRRDYKSILPEIKFGAEGTLTVEFPAGPPFTDLDTGVVNAPFYDDGFFGAFAGGTNTAATPFTFEGFTPLYIGLPVIGLASDNALGTPFGTESEYTPVGQASGSFGAFDIAVQTDVINETENVFVRNLAYGLTGDPFFFTQIIARSETGADIEDVYLGVFADFDIIDEPGDPSNDDLGGWNGERNLAYAFDAEMGQYYGVMAIVDEATRPGSVLSGYSTDVATADDAGLYTALTTAVPPAEDPVERAIVVGQGPYTLTADSAFVSQVFAIVAGLTEAELFANADLALERIGVAAEEVTEVGTYRLDSAFPNPFSEQARIGFSLPQAEEVSIVVYDMLGREVATLANGTYPAGESFVTLDAANLPSGVYVYRMIAGQTSLTERVTIVR